MSTQLSLESSFDDQLHDHHRPLNRQDWLCLSLMKGAGPTRLDRLWHYVAALEAEGDYESCFCSNLDRELFLRLKWPKETAHQASAYCVQGKLEPQVQAKLVHTLTWLQSTSHHLILRGEMEYPQKLGEIPVPPILLYVKGNLSCLSNICLGIVGARRCSIYGRQLGFQFAKQLSQSGVTVVSGGAAGIDRAAHEGANSTSSPNIAVMGTGLEKLYPKANLALFEQILNQGGALVSEYPLMTVGRPNLFPPRNRIISGLSEGVLVVEATEKSGSLISASYALQHNRDVFAVPGRINEDNTRGCHKLIQQGAVLVMDVEDILSELTALQNIKKATNADTTSSTSLVSTDLVSTDLVSTEKANPSSRTGMADNKQPSENKSDQESPLLLKPVEVPLETLTAVAQAVLRCFDQVEKNDVLEFTHLMDVIACGTSGLIQALIELEMFECIEPHATGYRRCYTV
ncbi:DNA-processing protein DprA [Marinomonas sp. 2405UD68-3]|uniref:DNA-processing protein DprA n=1 Tax=Marinomonas sp. 2405UD68-3 TaxID=3391835 RepID=UPI0039C9D4CB